MQSLQTRAPKLLSISPGLLITVCSFAAGICLAETLQLPAGLLLYILFLLSFLFVLHIRKQKPGKILICFLIGLLFFLLGLQHAKTFLKPPADPKHIYNLIDDQLSASLDGILLRYPSVIYTDSGVKTRILMQVKSIYEPSGQKRQMGKSTRPAGLVILTLKGLLPNDLIPGNRFLVKANLSRVDTISTPGSFNYKKYLANQSIFIKGWIKSPNNIIKLHTVSPSQMVSGITALKYLPERIRYHIADFLNQSLNQPARGLYKAILIGDRNDVPASVLENFTAAGCIHILAISGLHMGLLALVTIAVFTWILKRSSWLLLHTHVLKIAVSIALLPLLLYSLIAGFNIPVLRALLMTIVFILAILFDRPGNLINHILLAGFLIMAWKPGAIFTASFQLSFSTVIAIALIYPVVYRLLFQEAQTFLPFFTKPGAQEKSFTAPVLFRLTTTSTKWLLTGVALTTAAMLGSFPLLLFHFNRLSLVAPLSNLLVEPLICFWSLCIGLIASICIPLLPALAKVLFTAGSFGMILAERICAFFASLPHAFLWLPTPSPAEIALTYLFLICSFIALNLGGKPRLYFLVTALVFLCSLIATHTSTTQTEQPYGSASVTFLDVGHGSSILLQLPENKNILIDGGGVASDRFDIGERVIGPYLWNQKLRYLDAVVITHPHADHYNGLPFVLSRFRPQYLWVNGMPGIDREYSELLKLAHDLGIEVRVAKAGDLLFQGGSTRLLCIHSGMNMKTANPDEKFGHVKWNNPNDSSIVLRLETASRSFLFPADISSTMAETLVKSGRKLAADILMAPHHGSISSLSQDFIESVAPEYVAISAGRNNHFNFPAKSFYDLQKKGIKILSTDKDGTITFNVKNGEIGANTYQVH
jgi:competence protein ComEC